MMDALLKSQGTAEQTPFSSEHLSSFLDVGTRYLNNHINVKVVNGIRLIGFYFLQFTYLFCQRFFSSFHIQYYLLI